MMHSLTYQLRWTDSFVTATQSARRSACDASLATSQYVLLRDIAGLLAIATKVKFEPAASLDLPLDHDSASAATARPSLISLWA